MVDRVCRSLNFEIFPANNENAFELKQRMFAVDFENNTIPSAEAQVGKILGCTFNYYDGAAFIGKAYGQLGDYGVLVRSETLIITKDIIIEAYGSDVPECFKGELGISGTPDWSDGNGYPIGFEDALQNEDERLGYLLHDNANESAYPSGWYAPGGKTKYDFHIDPTTAKGLVCLLYTSPSPRD